MIYLEPTGGLCNRMRVMASFIEVARLTEQQITLLWRMDKGLNCEFSRLFLVHGVKQVYQYKVPICSWALGGWKKLSKIRELTPNELKNIRVDIELRNTFFTTNKNIYCKTDQSIIGIPQKGDFLDYYDVDYDVLQPREEILNEVNKITAQYGNYCIGVHVRRTDNEVAKKVSVLEEFYICIEREIEENDKIKIYLATDSPEVEKEIRSYFGEEYFIKKPLLALERNTALGIRDAYVELLCLSRTNKIYGSYYSSFSQVAASLGRIPCEIVGYGKLR